MRAPLFETRVCVNPQCGMRYPVETNEIHEQRCPNCRSSTVIAGELFGQLEIPVTGMTTCGPSLSVLLDNIRSAWNVGSMFRASDGAGVQHLYLGGVSPTPDNEKVAKTALGSERSVSWSHHMDGVKLCRGLREGGARIWALEGGQHAENIYALDVPADRPIVLVVGNERTGVDPGILVECERVICLPMSGQKGSLNVAVALGIAVYTLRFRSG